MALFGAGASFGSENGDAAVVPPLGDRLFEALAAFNPDGWGAVETGNGNLATVFRRDFELGMEEAARVVPDRITVLQRAMSAYFFRFVPGPLSLYVRLARALKRKGAWEGAFATLNYERLLELSLRSQDVDVHIGGACHTPGSVELCVPHGCCHLFCSGIQATGGVHFSGDIHVDGPLEIIEDPQKHLQRILGDMVPPVMSYFEARKRTMAGSSFIAGQRRRFRQLVSAAEVVAVVGVRVRPQDSHIWEPLATTKARILYCSGTSAGKEFRHWSVAGGRGQKDEVLEGYFCDHVDDLLHGLALS